MSLTSKSAVLQLKYRPAAYQFVDQALRYTQKNLGRDSSSSSEFDEDDAHISGPELLDGIRKLAIKQFGLMTISVFHHWGIHSTDDFGRIVFDFIERGVMRRTENDHLSDFFDVYDFKEVFDGQYDIDVEQVFH